MKTICQTKEIILLFVDFYNFSYKTDYKLPNVLGFVPVLTYVM